MITNKSNSVKLLTKIDNDSSYVKVYTAVNSNIEEGDKVYICSLNSNDFNSDLDNYQYFNKYSGETLVDIYANVSSYYYIEGEIYLQGYNVISIDSINNGITINRPYASLPVGTTNLTTNNFYIGKTYYIYSEIDDASLNGIVLRNTKIGFGGDINWSQGVVLDGLINTIEIKDKYSLTTVTLNSNVNEKNSVISNYSYNNNGYGYSVFSGVTNQISMTKPTIYNGNFYNCDIIGDAGILTSNFPIIYNGYYNNCVVYNNYKINNGYFYDSTILSPDTLWYNGTFDSYSGITTFSASTWYDGTWNRGNTPYNLVWFNGYFNGDVFSIGGEWANGSFNGNLFEGNTWNNGSFNKGTFKSLFWDDGIFNDGIFSSGIPPSTWKKGTFNGGVFLGYWSGGTFNGGDFSGSTWSGGTFNDGNFNKGKWYGGEFNSGKFNGNQSYWYDGNFYEGLFTDSTWYNGNFYNGDIINTTWYNGNFHYGRLYSVTWYTGTFYNGISNNTDYKEVDWYNGIFNSGNFSTTNDECRWFDGSFNGGVFGLRGQFHGGIFYDGKFLGEWYDGTFYIGDYSTAAIPPTNPIGIEYKPFLKETLVRNSNKKLTPNYTINAIKPIDTTIYIAPKLPSTPATTTPTITVTTDTTAQTGGGGTTTTIITTSTPNKRGGGRRNDKNGTVVAQ